MNNNLLFCWQRHPAWVVVSLSSLWKQVAALGGTTGAGHMCKDLCLQRKSPSNIVISTGSFFFLSFFFLNVFWSLRWIEGRRNWQRKQISCGWRRSLYLRRVGVRSRPCRRQWCRRCPPSRRRRRLIRTPPWAWMGEHWKSDAVFTPKIWFVHDIVY